MAFKYKPGGREYLLREINELDDLIYEELHPEEEYPHLFHNEDSLFAPDGMFEGPNNFVECNEITEEKLEHLDVNEFLEANREFNKNLKNNTNKARNADGSLECTFKPSISKKSSQMAVQMQPSFERLTMPVRSQNKKTPYKPNKDIQKQYSRERIDKLSKPRTLKTEPNEYLEERKLGTEKKSIVMRQSNSNYMDVAARNQLWEEQKKIKIEKLRREEEENKLRKESGTYNPKLTEYKGDKPASLSSFGKEGMANYFERVHMAKEKSSNYAGKENNISLRRESISPYCSNKMIKTPRKEPLELKKTNQRLKYDEAVKELHRKLMNLNI